MLEMSVKSPLFFEFYKIRESEHSRSYVSLFMMSKNEKEQELGRQSRHDTTLAIVISHPSKKADVIVAFISSVVPNEL